MTGGARRFFLLVGGARGGLFFLFRKVRQGFFLLNERTII